MLYIIAAFLICLLIMQIKANISSDNSSCKNKENANVFSFQLNDLNGKRINLNIPVISYNNDSILLGALNNRNSIFVRSTSNTCSACVKRLLMELNYLKSLNNKLEIILLIGGISDRDLYVNWINNAKLFKMFKLNGFELDSINDVENPILFKVNEEGTIISHFICQYGDTLQLQNYLYNINKQTV